MPKVVHTRGGSSVASNDAHERPFSLRNTSSVLTARASHVHAAGRTGCDSTKRRSYTVGFTLPLG
jgi:hypothetical protein